MLEVSNGVKRVKACILRTAGTNCDKETAFAFKKAGAHTELVHINRLISCERKLEDFQILAFPGGFSYGDDLGAGKIIANELRCRLSEAIKKFISDGKLIIGICNGFQILVKAGILPGNDTFKQEVSLVINDSAKFEDRWIYLRELRTENREQKCIWARNLPPVIYLPVAHGEGKFMVSDSALLNRLKRNKQIVFQYCDEKGNAADYPYNPNGSIEDIAGITDETGRILGLMPHPERHVSHKQHPRWTSLKNKKEGDGLPIIRNGVEYAKKTLL